jgi:hypothetical protein
LPAGTGCTVAMAIVPQSRRLRQKALRYRSNSRGALEHSGSATKTTMREATLAETRAA